MEVKFDCGNTTIILKDGKLWLAIFHGDDLFKKTSVNDVIDDVKAVAKLFIGVDEIPNIDVNECDDITLEFCQFNTWVLNLRNDSGEEKRYTIKKKHTKDMMS